jgi:hypothetical protein
MVEEVGELELGDGLSEGKLQEPYYGVNELKIKMMGRMPWLLLYRVWGQGMYKEEGSPDRDVMSLREGPS